MRQKNNVVLIWFIVVVCLAACALFIVLPPLTMNSGLVYKEF